MSTRHGIAVAVIALLCSACASTQVTESDRLRAQAAYDRALGQLQERQMSPALAALKEAAAVDPTVANYRDTLGVVYLDLGRPDLAIEQLHKAVELDPRLADAHFHLGTAYAESRRWEDAVASYRSALALPTLAIPDFVHQNLGLALYQPPVPLTFLVRQLFAAVAARTPDLDISAIVNEYAKENVR